MPEDAPLASLRVLDLAVGAADAVGRLLADLGADVLKIEPPGAAPRRTAAPTVAGIGIAFTLANANKRCAQLDPASDDDRERILRLAQTADIVIESPPGGGAGRFGIPGRQLAETLDHLVVLSVTDFGATGPYAPWLATDAVLYALSSTLSRTGPTSGTPVLPPDGPASGTAAVQATWAALAAYYDRLRSGRGEYIDFSRFEAVVQALDPPFGVEGQAAVGVKPPEQLWRGRPRNQQIYPTFKCRDGYVRLCLLSPRQWRAMWTWLGEPEQFADPRLETIAGRYAASQELNTAIGALFSSVDTTDLVTQGRARGVPVAAVLEPADVLSTRHFNEIGAFAEETLAPGVNVTVPVGPFAVDGVRHGYRKPPPPLGSDPPGWISGREMSDPRTQLPAAQPGSPPFEGLRILDLGVIVAGGELGRLFADLGAEVVKVESPAYPDGLRQTPPGAAISRSWALAHRNEESLGLDLRHADGAEVFRGLVRRCDAVFANFKPGTLADLGFSYEVLRELNPGIVLAESSAFGEGGQWSAQMGYGPLVRASSGVTRLWTSCDADPDACYDATTVFPDHIVGRLTAIGALAALIRRRTGYGAGAHVHISQAEAAINQLAPAYVIESACGAGLSVELPESVVEAVFPCAGADQWCVISLRTPSDRATVAALIGHDSLPADRSELIAAVSRWTSTQEGRAVAESLQRLGVAAAPMNRAADVLTDPQIVHREVFTEMTHPLLDHAIPAETSPAPFTRIPGADLRPAPMPGEHTHEICHRLLGLSPEQVDALITDGALFAYQKKN